MTATPETSDSNSTGPETSDLNTFLWELIERNHSKILDVAGFLSRRYREFGPSEAEDLAHDIMMRVFRISKKRCLSFKDDQHFMAWIKGVATYVAREHWRARKEATIALIEQAEESPREDDSNDLTQDLLASIQVLNADYRIVLELRLAGLKDAEIADYLNLTGEAVRQRIKRGIQMLREILLREDRTVTRDCSAENYGVSHV